MIRLGTPVAADTRVAIPSGRHTLRGIVGLPPHPIGVVVAHDSSSGRFSPRHQFVARILQERGLATLLLDLLEEDEADDPDKVIDVALLAGRLQSATHWLHDQPALRSLKCGYLGANDGAAVALVASARQPDRIGAVVSWGGRPELALRHLEMVRAPTLLVVGGKDDACLALNERAYALLRCPKELVVIPAATHLFPEPGALEEVAHLARAWFEQYLASA